MESALDSKRNMEQGRVICRVCRKSYCNKNSFRPHLRKRHSQNSFCVLCRHYIEPDETAASHLFSHHKIHITSACSCCNWTFSNQHVARRHCDRMVDKRWKAMGGQDWPAVVNDCPAGCFLNPSVEINEEYRDSLMEWQQNQRMNSATPESSSPLTPSSDPGPSSSVTRGETLSYDAWSVGLFQNLNFKFSNVVKFHIPNMHYLFLDKKTKGAQQENFQLKKPPIHDFSRFERLSFSPPIMDPAHLTSEIERLFPEFAPRPSVDESGGSRRVFDSEPGTSSALGRTSQCNSPLLRALLTSKSPTPTPPLSQPNEPKMPILIASTMFTPDSSEDSTTSSSQAASHSAHNYDAPTLQKFDHDSPLLGTSHRLHEKPSSKVLKPVDKKEQDQPPNHEIGEKAGKRRPTRMIKKSWRPWFNSMVRHAMVEFWELLGKLHDGVGRTRDARIRERRSRVGATSGEKMEHRWRTVWCSKGSA